MTTEPLYPDITVQLIGEDGNAFSILGNVTRQLKKHKIEQSVIDKFLKEATSGDYDNLLCTCMKYVNVE